MELKLPASPDFSFCHLSFRINKEKLLKAWLCQELLLLC